MNKMTPGIAGHQHVAKIAFFKPHFSHAHQDLPSLSPDWSGELGARPFSLLS